MFWADKIKEEAQKRFASKIKKGEPLIIRDEKTLSGRVHVGSLRGVVIHGIVHEVLIEAGISVRYFFELNDFDPMDGLPVYLDKDKFMPFMGRPLCDVPSPDGKAKNFAEYFGEEFEGVIRSLGFVPEFVRSSVAYKSGKYNDAIRLALDNADKIKKIYKNVSGSQKTDNWLPLSVICEKCGKVGTTRAYEWNGEQVSYECGDFVDWGKGCGHKGKVSPFDGNAKLPWKVEWAAKFSVFDVDIEGGGKDHSTKGGARDIADHISKEVFKREPPINIPYEFFNVGGKKMSSSKGSGVSAKQMADLLPPKMLRFLIGSKDPNRVIDFEPEGDTMPVLYDTYDTQAKSYFAGTKDDFARAFPFYHLPGERGHLSEKKLPRFSLIAFLAQMPHMDPAKEIEAMEGVTLTEADKKELKLRLEYAKIWLAEYAPANYKFEIQKSLPESAKNLNELQKQALAKILEFVKGEKILDGQKLHERLHEIKTELLIDPKLLFSAIYLSILGRDSGPKAGWFLSVLDKNFLENRFNEVTAK
ncbi:MAG TPA: lysine--tRNA ligase [Candidatus Paceibacterota bacterium]